MMWLTEQDGSLGSKQELCHLPFVLFNALLGAGAPSLMEPRQAHGLSVHFFAVG